MLQISAALSSLTTAQRQAVADFILNFPTDPEEVSIPAFSVIPEEAFSLTDAPMLTEPAPPVVFPIPMAVPDPPAVITPASHLDAAGLPWDERIHASSKVKVADGTWRKKRGVADSDVATVEAQLKQLMAIPTRVVASVPAPIEVVPPPPVIATVPPPPATSAAADRQMYVDLIGKASAAIAGKKLTQDELNGFVVAAGVPSLPLLANRLDLVPQVIASVDMLIASRV